MYDVNLTALKGAENRISPVVLCDGEQIRLNISDCPSGLLVLADNGRTRRSVRVENGAALLPHEFSCTSILGITLAVFDGGACVDETALPPIVVVKASGAYELRDWVKETEERLADLEAAVFGQSLAFMDQI